MKTRTPPLPPPPPPPLSSPRRRVPAPRALRRVRGLTREYVLPPRSPSSCRPYEHPGTVGGRVTRGKESRLTKAPVSRERLPRPPLSRAHYKLPPLPTSSLLPIPLASRHLPLCRPPRQSWHTYASPPRRPCPGHRVRPPRACLRSLRHRPRRTRPACLGRMLQVPLFILVLPLAANFAELRLHLA